MSLAICRPTASAQTGSLAKNADSDTQRAELSAAGPKSSLTIYPVFVLGQPDRNVADVLGLVLEKRGMDQLEATDAKFTPTAGQEWDAIAVAFGNFVRQNPLKTPHALYAEYLGEPKAGPTEVRWVIVDQPGNVVIADRQTAADPDFKRTAGRDRDPLGCSALVAERVFSQLKWKTGGGSAEGKFARLWAEKSGTPEPKERAAIAARMKKWSAEAKTATLGVYATRVNTTANAESSVRLAAALTQKIGGSATPLEPAPSAKISFSSNQQKRLWDLAKVLREHARANPPTTDYVLLAEYLIEPGGAAQAVHVIVCDKTGEWVLVDFQNNQHADFQRFAPKSLEDCERLALERVCQQLR